MQPFLYPIDRAMLRMTCKGFSCLISGEPEEGAKKIPKILTANVAIIMLYPNLFCWLKGCGFRFDADVVNRKAFYLKTPRNLKISQEHADQLVKFIDQNTGNDPKMLEVILFIESLVASGNLTLVNRLKDEGLLLPFIHHIKEVASATGQIEIFDQPYGKDNSTATEYLYTAAKYGQLEFIKWYRGKLIKKVATINNGRLIANALAGRFINIADHARDFFPKGEIWFEYGDSELIFDCVGQLESLSWLSKNKLAFSSGFFWSYMFERACKEGHVESVRWMIEHQYQHLDLNRGYPKMCAYRGQTECLKVLKEKGFTFSPSIAEEAIISGNTESLEWLVSQGFEIVEPRCCTIAVRHGRLAVLRWLKGRGYKWNKKLCINDAQTEDIKRFIENYKSPKRSILAKKDSKSAKKRKPSS